jgi:hypothetical protein
LTPGVGGIAGTVGRNATGGAATGGVGMVTDWMLAGGEAGSGAGGIVTDWMLAGGPDGLAGGNPGVVGGALTTVGAVGAGCAGFCALSCFSTSFNTAWLDAGAG